MVDILKFKIYSTYNSSCPNWNKTETEQSSKGFLTGQEVQLLLMFQQHNGIAQNKEKSKIVKAARTIKMKGRRKLHVTCRPKYA